MKRFFKTILILFLSMHLFTTAVFAYDKIDKLEDAENVLYNHFENRENNFSILYAGEKKEFEDNELSCIKNAFSKDDYLERCWQKITYNNKEMASGIEATFDVTYLTTREQEDYVENELKKITELLVNENMSDFEKVRVINEYIIDRYQYDYSQKYQDAYSALTTSFSTCQGYSMTAYKMLKYAGVENRIVVGNINKDISHSWNLVEIEGNWFQLDITNNDSIERDKYFLVGDDTLISKGYTWDRSKYPQALMDYYITEIE